MTAADPRIADAEPIAIQKGISSEVYFSLPASSQPQNLVDGVVYISPPPTDEHEDVVLAVAQTIDAWARANGGKVFVGRDCWLGEETVVQPDVAYLAASRTGVAGRFLREAPDLVVEVVSNNTRRFDMEEKFRAYADTAVREAWFVDLVEEETTVFIVEGERWEASPPVQFGEAVPSALLTGIGAAGLDSAVAAKPLTDG
jgi:Uma2 family endonuclease